MTTIQMAAFTGTFLLTSLFGGAAYAAETHAHHVPPVGVTLRLAQADTKPGDVAITFTLNAASSGKALAESALAVSHEKKLHLFVFDSGLNEFRHLHPTYRGGRWTARTTLAAGQYRVWAQGKTKAGAEDFTAGAHLTVVGGDGTNAKAPSLNEQRSGTDGNARVTLSDAPLNAGQPVELLLTMTRTDGTLPALTPYLGANAHVVAVSESGDDLLHVHPMNGNGKNELLLHTVFPSTGSFRLWVEFVDGGKRRVVPLAMKVAK